MTMTTNILCGLALAIGLTLCFEYVGPVLGYDPPSPHTLRHQ